MEHTIDLDTVLYICGLIVSISGAAAVINRVVKKSLNKTMKDSIDKYYSSYSESFNDKLDDVYAQLESSLQCVHQELVTYKELQQEANEKVRRSLLASMRDRINQAHDYYCRRGWIGAHSLFIIEELYTSYKENQGNGFVDRQMEDIRNLEVRSVESDKPSAK